ncbi:MAG: cbb3-type cytochrome c oxidase subunit I [Hahellaceae bacterium]|nr:cbb3-type cytochrome c oxidase subunit I [Hahellaceae bacterium]MCP5212698.1 cbb3-type cytochrome c oxidase subunit I [Hahellaceae bacterium]
MSNLMDLSESNQKLATYSWISMGVFALIAAGVFSVLVVVSRIPGVQEWIPFIDFFHTALVVHVDLLVLVWFMSFSAAIWSAGSTTASDLFDQISLLMALCGALVLILCPFTGVAEPVINNYFPVLQHPLFYSGLLLFSFGIVIKAMLTLAAPSDKPITPLTLGVKLSAAISIAAFLLFVWAYQTIPGTLETHAFFEVLFWGSGHTLQISHTVLVIIAWFILLQGSGYDIAATTSQQKIAITLCALPALVAPVLYFFFSVESAEHRFWFTRLMQIGGLFSLPAGLLLLLAFLRKRKLDVDENTQGPARSALYNSLLLFTAGGIIGFLIEGVNVVIPAHYHGSIVGITLAFMGLTYLMLPQLGYNRPYSKWARRQPWIYGIGQLMHVLGLAWSGGYGVQRKTAGAAQMLDQLPEIIGMRMMGLGGGIAIIGVVIFLVIVLRTIKAGRQD